MATGADEREERERQSRLVRERRARTGEDYAPALRAVRAELDAEAALTVFPIGTAVIAPNGATVRTTGLVRPNGLSVLVASIEGYELEVGLNVLRVPASGEQTESRPASDVLRQARRC